MKRPGDIMIDFDQIYNELIKQSNDCYLGGIRLYKRVLKMCNNNHEIATKFMISDFGGFTKPEVNKIRYKIVYNKKTYRNEASNNV